MEKIELVIFLPNRIKSLPKIIKIKPTFPGYWYTAK